MKKRNKLNKKETELLKPILKPGYVLDETIFGITFTRDEIVSWEDIPLGEEARRRGGIHIKRTSWTPRNEQALNLGYTDYISDEPIVEIKYFTRQPNSISFEKCLEVSN